MKSVFPFTLYAASDGRSDSRFQSAFLKAKPEKLVWYCFDVIVESPTAITFIVYDMRDNTYGGKGDKIAEFKAKVDTSITKKSIDQRILYLAECMREEELERIESEAIAKYAEQIRATISQ